MPRRKLLLAFAPAALVAGCAAVPHLPPAASLDAHPALETATSLNAGQADFPPADWWRSLNDPQLTALIEQGLRDSPDVAAAAARIRAADALAGQARAATLPQVSADGTAGINQQSRALGIPPQFVPQGIQDAGRVTLSGSFDLDLWGRNRARLRAATSEAQAVRVDAAQATLMLSTSIAGAYADLARYYSERDVAVDAQRTREATLTLTRQRVQFGIGTQGEIAQAAARASSARADVQIIDEQIVLTRNRLAALVGSGPDRGLTIAPPRLTAPGVALPANLPLELLGRRPDIVSARLRAEAQTQRIRAARAEFYPNINLNGLIGLQSLGLTNLFTSNALYLNAGPAISLPIFDGGRLSANYRNVRATYDLDVAQYESVLVTALREVADAAGSLSALEGQLAAQRTALSQAADAKRIAELRYRAGLANQLTVLTTDDLLLQLRRQVADTEARGLTLQVQLIRALGGGFRMQAAAPAPAQSGGR